jgi:hypothetical protein
MPGANTERKGGYLEHGTRFPITTTKQRGAGHRHSKGPGALSPLVGVMGYITGYNL